MTGLVILVFFIAVALLGPILADADGLKATEATCTPDRTALR